jgi:homoserine kinase type II
VELGRTSLAVQRVVPGEPLDVTDLDLVRDAGAVLARLHVALATSAPAHQVAATLASPQPLPHRLTSWLDPAPGQVPEVAVEHLRRLVADAPAFPTSTQLFHGDFRAANLLCSASGVAAVLDFEEARLDAPVAELARAAVLLGTRFHDWAPVGAEVHQALFDGYRSQRDVTADEAAWWPVLLLWNSLLTIPAGADPTGWQSAATELIRGTELPQS